MIEQSRQVHGDSREIGLATDDGQPILLTNPDRKGHLHILGAPDEGKSMFLYGQICADIDQGLGCWLLDPNGGTARNVLKYCISKDFRKVVYINPKDFWEFNAWPTINPLIRKAPTEAVNAVFMDSIRNIWSQKDASSTSNINKYLEAVIYVLHKGGYSLNEARYFLDQTRYAPWQKKILEPISPYNENRVFIEGAMKDKFAFNNFQSTVNRLNPFFKGSLRNMFASTECPISFQHLIDQRYAILVTMDASDIGEMSQKLLGTVVINYLLRAKERREGDTTPYYLYIDEVGQFATKKLEYILDHKRHIGMRMIMAHQRYDQLGDYEPGIKSAKGKILFYSAVPEDRLKSAKMMFGGDVQDRDAAYYAGKLKKQEAIIKLGKQPPVTVRFHHLDVPNIDSKQIDQFKKEVIYNQSINPFYRSSEQIREEIRKRFALPNSTAPKAGAEHGNQQSVQADTAGDTGSSVFDGLADSAAVLRKKKGRKRPNPPEEKPSS